jgi:perosamine synthetase
MTIQLNRPFYHPEAYKNVKRVLESGWSGLGPEVEAFEQEFATYLGAKYVVGTSSGTEALRLSVVSAHLTKGSIIITTPNTFVSTGHVILQSGFIPYFVDIDLRTGSLSIDSVHKALKDKGIKVGAIMVVHYGGMPIDVDEFKDLADRYCCELFEDAAHCSGSEYKGTKVGSGSRYCSFSFHAVKNLSMGDGGAIATNDKAIYNYLKQLRWLGIDKSTLERSQGGLYSWDYDCPVLGFKSHLNDVSAAIGRGQLLHLDEDNKYRMSLVDRYLANLRFMENITPIGKQIGKVSSNHMFVVRFKTRELRERAMMALQENGIQYGHHYKNNALYSPYKHLQHGPLPNMEIWNDTALTLPLHLGVSLNDVDYICDTIDKSLT